VCCGACVSHIPGAVVTIERGLKGITAGACVGNYEIVQRLTREGQEGSFGVIYRAKVVADETLVALKFLRRPDGIGDQPRAAMKLRFEAERKALEGIGGHAHVVSVHGGGEFEGFPYIAVEWTNGISLAEWMGEPLKIQGRRYQWERTPGVFQSIMDQVCRGVARIHDSQIDKIAIVHRDLKPENVMKEEETRDNNTYIVARVIDLGSA
jgi:serine/threonine protein kinase